MVKAPLTTTFSHHLAGELNFLRSKSNTREEKSCDSHMQYIELLLPNSDYIHFPSKLEMEGVDIILYIIILLAIEMENLN